MNKPWTFCSPSRGSSGLFHVQVILMAIVVIFAIKSVAHGETLNSGVPVWHETGSVTAAGIEAEDWFGSSLAGFGDTLVIGAYEKHATGSAYQFKRSAGEWIQTREFLPSDPNVLAFGIKSAMSADWTIVGAPEATFDKRYPGTVFSYDLAGNVEVVRAPNMKAVDRFGSSVAIDGSTLVVGAQGADRRGGQSGSAYIFERQGHWQEVQELLPSKTASDSNFGISVAIAGNRIIGGATSFSGGVSGGQAFIFEKQNGGWIEEVELSEITPGFKDGFGLSVAINDRFAVVGSPGNFGRVNSHEDGAVFIYEKGLGGWTLRQTLTPFAGTGQRSQFGRSVAISDKWLLVGAMANSDEGTNTGSGYLFNLKGDEWIPTARLTSNSPLNEQLLGESAYIGADFFALGAPSLSTADPSVGYVQFFEVPEPNTAMMTFALSIHSSLLFRRRRR
jgi:hypothetical protein